MKMNDGHWDPRVDELSHDILEGQVYGDTRHEPDEDEEWDDHALYTIIYVDEHVVVMKSNNWTSRTNHRTYRQDPRDVFEKNAGSGRYRLLEEVDGAPDMPDDLTEIRALGMRMRNHYAEQGGRVNNHKAEAMSEFVEKLQELEPEEIDVEDVSGVGEGTAEKLSDAGYTTDVAIQNAGKDALTDVPGVGDAVAERLLDKASA
jgi:hypothetical protein